MARIHFIVAKYTFFIIVVFGAGLAIERWAGIKRWWKSESLSADDLIYNVSSPITSKNLDSVLSRQYIKCVTQPAKPFCLLTASRRLEIFGSEQADSPDVEEIERRLQNITLDHEPRRRRIHSLLVAFTGLVETKQVKVLLVEPSMLFCLLSDAKKFGMLSRGFNPGRLLGSRNVVTVGVLAEDSKKLEEGNLTREMLADGFKIKKFRKWIGEESEKSFETVHCFFILRDVAIHVVTFYPRKAYLWHAGLNPKEIDFEGLLFVNEGIFESFTMVPLNLSGSSINRMYLPHDVRYFMTEMETSRTLECSANSSGPITSVTHPNLTSEQLRVRVVIALNELKRILATESAFFWLWSKTLSGWFTECDVFHYSATLDLAVTLKGLQGLNFHELLDENEFLKEANFNESGTEFKYKLDCHGLLVNIFVLREDEDGLWYRSDEDERLTFPVFQLCSSQVFGQKIHVPCDPDVILKLENSRNRINDSALNILNKNNSFSDETGG